MNDFLLNLFTGTDEFRPAMMFPNAKDGMVYATDIHGLIVIPEDQLSLSYKSNEAFPNTKSVIDGFCSKELKSVKVNVHDLSLELTKARIWADRDSIKCNECKGSGSVESTYHDKKGATHNVDIDCPVCDGDGFVEKDQKFARIKLEMIEKEDGTLVGIFIDHLYFHPFQLYRLFMVASLKRVDEFEIFYDPKQYGQTISHFGNIKVLVMLMTPNPID